MSMSRRLGLTLGALLLGDCSARGAHHGARDCAAAEPVGQALAAIAAAAVAR